MTSYLWILFIGALLINKSQEFDLNDALDEVTPTPKPAPPKPPKKEGDGGFDLFDGLPDENEPKADPNKPKAEEPVKPLVPEQGGGEFGLSDLEDAGKELNPDRVNTGDSTGDTDTQDDQPKAAEGGQMAAIISGVAVAIFGAASSYFAYQKKKLCFKIQGGTDPESGRNQSGTQSDPQAFSNLLQRSS